MSKLANRHKAALERLKERKSIESAAAIPGMSITDMNALAVTQQKSESLNQAQEAKNKLAKRRGSLGFGDKFSRNANKQEAERKQKEKEEKEKTVPPPQPARRKSFLKLKPLPPNHAPPTGDPPTTTPPPLPPPRVPKVEPKTEVAVESQPEQPAPEIEPKTEAAVVDLQQPAPEIESKTEAAVVESQQPAPEIEPKTEAVVVESQPEQPVPNVDNGADEFYVAPSAEAVMSNQEEVVVPLSAFQGNDVKEEEEVVEEAEWYEGWDESRQLFYYFNSSTNESSWEKPNAAFVPYIESDGSESEGSEEEDSEDDEKEINGAADESMVSESEAFAWMPSRMDERQCRTMVGEVMFNDDEFRRLASYHPSSPYPTVDRGALMALAREQLVFELDADRFRALSSQRAVDGNPNMPLVITSVEDLSNVFLELMFDHSKFMKNPPSESYTQGF